MTIIRQTPDRYSARQAKVCSKSQSLENIGATTDAAVDANGYLAFGGRSTLAESVERCGNCVELSATMVRDDDAVETVTDC